MEVFLGNVETDKDLLFDIEYKIEPKIVNQFQIEIEAENTLKPCLKKFIQFLNEFEMPATQL